MKKSLLAKSFSGWLLVAFLFAGSRLAFSQINAGPVDIQIDQLKVLESTTADGHSELFIIALFSNRQKTAVENCTVSAKVNNATPVTETFTKIENGPTYLYSSLYSGSGAITSSSKVQVSVCPDAAGEKNNKNNTRTVTMRLKDAKILAEGNDIDLSIAEFKTLSVRDKLNSDRIWYAYLLKNSGNNLAPASKTRLTVNGNNQQIIPASSLPGKSASAYSGFYLAQPDGNNALIFEEGKNLIAITADYEQLVKESNEKNSFYFQAIQADKIIQPQLRSTTEQQFILQGLLIINQNVVNDDTLPPSPNGLLLTLPILNTLNTIIASETHTLKAKLTVSGKTYEQSYDISDWKAGTMKNLNFTNNFFTKSQLAKVMSVKILFDEKSVFTGNLKPAAFY